MIISVTERQQFKTCRRQWAYKWKHGLDPAREPINHFWVGTAVHRSLDEWYSGGVWEDAFEEYVKETVPPARIDSMMGDERDRFMEAESLASGMMQNYVDHFAEDLNRWRVVGTEVELYARIPKTTGWLSGTFDLLILDEFGKFWIVDHKTYATFYRPDQLELDDQMTAYLWLIRNALGIEARGVIYNQMRKKLPTVPEPLKKGGLTRAKSLDTTYEVYLAAIKEHGLDVMDYADVLDRLASEGNRFFKREEVYRSRTELEAFTPQLVDEYREMSSTLTQIYPHLTYDCAWRCPFLSLCRMESQGGPWRDLASSQFTEEHDRRGRKYGNQRPSVLASRKRKDVLRRIGSFRSENRANAASGFRGRDTEHQVEVSQG